MFELRPYQKQAIAAVQEAWRHYSDVLLLVATGGGKTAIFLSLLNQDLKPGERALILAHRQELVEQPRDRLLSYYPEWAGRIGVVMAEQADYDRQITVATVQSLANEQRLQRLLRSGPIHYLIVDEAHHAVADSYVQVYQSLRAHNPALRHLGVTATPLRTDRIGLGAVYQHVAGKWGIRELVAEGWLVPPRWLAIQTGISIAGVTVRSCNGDREFSQRQLADVYETANCWELVVASHRRYASGRRALAFTASVEGAYRLAETFTAAGIPAAAADGTTPKGERTAILAAFRRGEIQVLANMNLFTEGLDVPEVSCIHQVRPTQSDLIYTQMIGRALRPVPGKCDALILDYAPVEARNVVMAGDVLGVKVRKEAYIQDSREPGAVIGGFTYDGKVRWLNGSPMELISRTLDYMSGSAWQWERDASGWLILGLGRDEDGIDRTLAMSPVSDVMRLYGVLRTAAVPGNRVMLLQTGSLEELSTWAEDYAWQHGLRALAGKRAWWRKQPPTDAQQELAERLGIRTSGLFRGEVAAAITRVLALRALRMARVA